MSKSIIFDKGAEVPVFNSATVEEIEELQRQSNDTYLNRLAVTEKDILDAYTTGLHEEINPLLYETVKYPVAVQEEYWKYISCIDSAMGKFDLKQDIMVYSGTEAKWYLDWNVGDVKPIKAYLSTAVTKQIPDDHYKKIKGEGKAPLMFEIYVPKGTKCIYIGNNTKHPAPEYEMLLGRGQKYKVIERTENLMRLEIVNE